MILFVAPLFKIGGNDRSALYDVFLFRGSNFTRKSC